MARDPSVMVIPYKADGLIKPCAYQVLLPDAVNCPRPHLNIDVLASWFNERNASLRTRVITVDNWDGLTPFNASGHGGRSTLNLIQAGLADISVPLVLEPERYHFLHKFSAPVGYPSPFFLYKYFRPTQPNLDLFSLLEQPAGFWITLLLLWLARFLLALANHLRCPSHQQAVFQRRNVALISFFQGLMFSGVAGYLFHVLSKTPVYQPPFIHDVDVMKAVLRGDYRLIAVGKTIVQKLYLLRPHTQLDRDWNRHLNTSVTFLRSQTQLEDLIHFFPQEQRDAWPKTLLISTDHDENYLKLSSLCLFQLHRPNLLVGGSTPTVHFLNPHSSLHLSIADVMRLRQMFEQLSREYYPRQCSQRAAEERAAAGGRGLSLLQMLGAFVLLGLAQSATLVWLCIELLWRLLRPTYPALRLSLSLAAFQHKARKKLSGLQALHPSGPLH